MRLHEIITETQQLDEVPLPSNWEEQHLSSRRPNTFKSRVDYALSKAEALGIGSARVVVRVKGDDGQDTALKIARNRKGLGQNAVEARIIMSGDLETSNITIPMIDYDRKNTPPQWIQTAVAKPVTQRRLSELLHTPEPATFYISDVLQLFKIAKLLPGTQIKRELAWYKAKFLIHGKNDKDFEIFLDYIKKIRKLVAKTKILEGDMTMLDNWGEYQGRPVIIDLGFADEVLNLYHK